MLTRTPTMELRETQIWEQCVQTVEKLVDGEGPYCTVIGRSAWYAGYDAGYRDCMERVRSLEKILARREELIQALQGIKS